MNNIWNLFKAFIDHLTNLVATNYRLVERGRDNDSDYYIHC